MGMEMEIMGRFNQIRSPAGDGSGQVPAPSQEEAEGEKSLKSGRLASTFWVRADSQVNRGLGADCPNWLR